MLFPKKGLRDRSHAVPGLTHHLYPDGYPHVPFIPGASPKSRPLVNQCLPDISTWESDYNDQKKTLVFLPQISLPTIPHLESNSILSVGFAQAKPKKQTKKLNQNKTKNCRVSSSTLSLTPISTCQEILLNFSPKYVHFSPFPLPPS